MFITKPFVCVKWHALASLWQLSFVKTVNQDCCGSTTVMVSVIITAAETDRDCGMTEGVTITVTMAMAVTVTKITVISGGDHDHM